ncbi:non-homologous end-joining factor 1-like [Daphnia carinata]|uniref:non-homologous end-joining factor 1-like n=1 Tax=Daphnia carinata TaxID=120202 RepID=UPI002579FCC7|nr:non-homologous end-joining factor 1-like [Daphnia carinata]
MDALGWLKIGSDGYAVRFESDEEKYVTCLTDMASLWCQQQTANEIMKRCQDLNPLIETTAKGLIRQLRAVLANNPESHNLRVDSNNQIAILRIESRLESNLPFIWEFDLTLENADQFRSFVIRPLLAMLSEAVSIEDELCTIIRSKDKQIDDYKASGASVSRRNLETKEFNAEAFFASRPWRTIDESVKEDITALFCRVVVRLKQLYSTIAKRILSQKLMPVLNESSESTKSISEEIATPRESSSKESETSRAEAIRKRLYEEELNEMAKSAKKAKIKKIL